MPVICYETKFPKLSRSDLDAWADVPAAVASDCLNRSQAMVGAIKPLATSMRITAQARTVACTVADNSALHAAIGRCEQGEVLVCDGQAYQDAALFGGLMTKAALHRGIAGLVLDGAVRDSLEIIDSGFPCFVRAVVPGGPHKEFGGKIDGTISCGGISVSPGDLIIADADGVTAVPFSRINETLEAAKAVMAKEENTLQSLAEGGSLAEIYGVPDIIMVPAE